MGLYQQTIRIWAVDRSHDVAQRSIQRVVDIHKRGLSSVITRKLRSRVQRIKGTDVVLPKTYQVAPEGIQSLAELQQGCEPAVAVEAAESEACPAASGGAFDEQLTIRYPPAVEQEDAYNLVKFYTLERSLVWSILAATFTEKLEFPFLPDETEHLIITLSERRSVLLIGRSGTGKTTIVVQRMWLKFRERLEAIAQVSTPAAAKTGLVGAADAVTEDPVAVDPELNLHQLFVTANPILRTSVAKSFKSLQSGFIAAMGDGAGAQDSMPDTATDEDLPSLNGVHEASWPLFLRAHHWLRLLDGTILDESERFFTEDERLAAAASVSGWHSEKGGLDELPELEDDDDEVDDVDESEVGALPPSGVAAGSAGGAAAGSLRRARLEMTYDLFEHKLWPLMVGKEAPGADDAKGSLHDMQVGKDLLEKARRCPLKPSLVFREIVSYIKGSSQALESEDGRLSKAAYLSIGRKMAPTFDKVEDGDGAAAAGGSSGRELVYDLFRKYEAWKDAYGCYDVMDACVSIFRALRRQGGYRGPRIDEMYVDEVQDFTQAEIRLFLEVTADGNALFLTGDTCQTISRGVGFRFEDLTTMFYQVREAQKVRLQQAGRRLEDVPSGELIHVPVVNTLTVNYRTHNGILGAASEVVSLLLELFPHSVDALEKDVGFFNGPLPTLLSDTSKDDLSMLLFGSDPAHSQIEFGAHQVVLVRDQHAKLSLPGELQSALVLTVFEAKGLEFDDVFLYNFFTDSPADERTWRVVTGLWERDLAVAGQAQDTGRAARASHDEPELTMAAPRPETFDRQRHSLLNEELKMLYTAITRARVKVVVYDVAEEKRRPMFHYLLSKRLAKVFDTRETTRGLAAASTAEEWTRQARNLMRQQLFAIAALCFQRADDKTGMLEALAMHYYSPTAAAATDGRPADRYLRAARCFELAGHTPHAAACLKRAGEHTLAAAAYRKAGQPIAVAKTLAAAAERATSRREALELFTAAANAWVDAGRLTQALLIRLSHKELHAAAFEMLNAPEHDRLRAIALPHLEARKMYDAAIVVCRQMGQGDKVEDLLRRSAFHHQRRGDKAAMFTAVKQFKSPEMQIAFLRQHGERRQVIELMKSHGQVHEAHDEMLSSPFVLVGGELEYLMGKGGEEEAAELPPNPIGASAVQWLACVFRLASVVKSKPADGAKELLDGALLSTLRGLNGMRALWIDLLMCLLFDALREGGERSGALEASCRQIIDGVTLTALEQLLQSVGRLLACQPAELRAATDTFLRLRGSAKPLARLPSWRWLCARANHDGKDLLISGSERLRRLVHRAVVETAMLALAQTHGLPARLRSSLISSERALTAQRKTPQMICESELSGEYLQTLWHEVLVLLRARVVFRLAGERGLLHDLTTKPDAAASYAFKRPNAMQAAGMLVSALWPETNRERDVPDLSGTLPHALHPFAKAAMLRKIAAAREAREEPPVPFDSLLTEWLQAVQSKQPPHPLTPVRLVELLNSLELTATQWRVYCSPLVNDPASFKSRLAVIDTRAAKANLWSDPAVHFDLGPAGGRVHVSVLLRLVTLYESAGGLQQACQPAADYLESCVRLCDNGGLANVSFATCSELIERASCYYLALSTHFSGLEVWLPRSLAALHLLGRDSVSPLRTAAMLKSSTELFSRTIEAALRLCATVLSSTAYRVQMRYGLAMVERTAVMLLLTWVARARIQPYARLFGRGGFWSAEEAENLLIRPLRALPEQLNAASASEQQRLRAFGAAVGLCVKHAHPDPTHLPKFMEALQALLTLRHDTLCAVSWTSSWAAGLAAPYFALYLPRPDAAESVLATAVATVSRAIASPNPKAIVQVIETEPGWKGLRLATVHDAFTHSAAEVPVLAAAGDDTTAGGRAAATNNGAFTWQLVVRPFEGNQGLADAVEADAMVRAGTEAYVSLVTLDDLWIGKAPGKQRHARRDDKLKQLRRVASRADGRTSCINRLVRLAAGGVAARRERANGMLEAHIASLVREATAEELGKIRYVLSVSPHLKPAGVPLEETASVAMDEATCADSSLQDSTAEAAEAPASVEPTDARADDGERELKSSAEQVVGDGNENGEAEDVDVEHDDDEEEDAFYSADEDDDADDPTQQEALYQDLIELEQEETSRFEHLSADHRKRARLNIEESKARAIQRAWRARADARADGNGADEVVDEAVAMYRERLQRYASVAEMERSGWCLFCGTEWAAGHAGNAHWGLAHAFSKHYRTMVHESVAPLLARLDGARASMQAAEAADEGAETARFQASHELERSYTDLNCAMDHVEAKQAWEHLDELKSAVEFANLALDAASGLAAGGAADGATRDRDDLAMRSARVGGGDGCGPSAGGDSQQGVGDEDDDEEESELDHLAQMVARQAKWTTRGQRRMRSGAAGKRK